MSKAGKQKGACFGTNSFGGGDDLVRRRVCEDNSTDGGEETRQERQARGARDELSGPLRETQRQSRSDDFTEQISLSEPLG